MALSFGKISQVNIAQLDYRLQRLLYRFADIAPKELDLTIVCGYRGEAEQNKAFQEGRSQKPWPASKHNLSPSQAFDFTPYPFAGKKDWEDTAHFARVVGALQLAAALEGITIRVGIDFSGDGRTVDERFVDAGHVELA